VVALRLPSRAHKLAMDRFIPLRFRALTSTEQNEEVKW
jgi:hypothetical protein